MNGFTLGALFLRPTSRSRRQTVIWEEHTPCVVSTRRAISLKDARLSPDVAICAILWSVPHVVHRGLPGLGASERSSERRRLAHVWAVLGSNEVGVPSPAGFLLAGKHLHFRTFVLSKRIRCEDDCGAMH